MYKICDTTKPTDFCFFTFKITWSSCTSESETPRYRRAKQMTIQQQNQSCLPIVWVGLTELGLFSWGRLSEFRVARGLAIGAVDLSFVSPVQRRVNWSVGPWENVSNGGNLWGKNKKQNSRISVFPCTKTIMRKYSQNGYRCNFLITWSPCVFNISIHI